MNKSWSSAALRLIPAGEPDPGYQRTLDLKAENYPQNRVFWYERGGNLVCEDDLKEPKLICIL